MKKIAILGSTGSIGTQTLEVVNIMVTYRWKHFLPTEMWSFWKSRPESFIRLSSLSSVRLQQKT